MEWIFNGIAKIRLENNLHEEVNATNPMIIYSISGSSGIILNGTKFNLNKGNFLLVNKGVNFSINSNQTKQIVLLLILDERSICSKLKIDNFIFNMSQPLLDMTVTDYLNNLSNILVNSSNELTLLVESKIYETVNYILTTFSEEIEESENSVEEMTGYIKKHYSENIDLKEVSQHFFMETSYFSKYFKKHVGINYKQFLDNVRMEKAAEKLSNTNQPIVQVSIDTGFNSLSSFNKIFKSFYSCTPSQYRKKVKSQNNQNEVNEENTKYDLKLKNLGKSSKKDITIDLKIESGQNLKKVDIDLILNVGELANITTIGWGWRDHITLLNKKRSFKYLRMVIEDNFARDNLSDCSDMLISLIEYADNQNIKPWIVFRITSCYFDKVFEQTIVSLLESISSYTKKSIVKDWMFEIELTSEETVNYLKSYTFLWKYIKQYFKESKIGGIGVNLETWKEMENELLEVNLDFITINYIESAVNKENCLREKVNDIVQKYNREVYFPEMGLAFKEGNYLNDSLFNASYFLNNIIQIMDIVKGIGYIKATDLLSDNYQPSSIISSGQGLLTIQGIEKPILSVFKILDELNNFYIVQSGKNYSLVTMDDDLYLLGNNVTYPLITDINAPNIDPYFSQEKLVFNIKIANIDNGSYELRYYRCYKGVLDEWHELSYSRHLRFSDFKYLIKKTDVNLQLEAVNVKDNKIKLQKKVAPNNFFIVHFRKKGAMFKQADTKEIDF